MLCIASSGIYVLKQEIREIEFDGERYNFVYEEYPVLTRECRLRRESKVRSVSRESFIKIKIREDPRR